MKLQAFSARAAGPARALRQITPSLARAAHGDLPAPRRVELRREVRFGCRVRRIDRSRLVGDRALDLSPRGMLLLSDEVLELGTEVDVSFVATELSIWFDTRAVVTRVVQGRRPHDVGRALGLRFETLPSVLRLVLRGHLRKLPLQKPQRALPEHLVRPPEPDYARLVREIYDGR